MSRRTERAMLGLLAFASAVFALVVGVRLMAGGSVDVAANAPGLGGSVDPASASIGDDGPSSGAGAGAEGSSDSLVVSTTAVLVESSSTSSTATTEATTTSSSSTPTTEASTSTSSSSTDSSSTPTSESTTTTTAPASSESTTDNGADGADTTATTAPAESSTTSSTGDPGPERGLTAIERQIVALTNELRTNPSGPLKRQGPTPQCVIDGDDIELDPDTGQPKPVARLTASEGVSVNLSRDWSQQMADADAMSHRGAESQDEIYAALGIDWAVRGENVAWAIGYQPSEVAQLFFSGWRESDAHYCNMMSSAYTHIGVGHVRSDGGKDFATQNFYRPR